MHQSEQARQPCWPRARSMVVSVLTPPTTRGRKDSPAVLGAGEDTKVPCFFKAFRFTLPTIIYVMDND
jgi:hypothetical protein